MTSDSSEDNKHDDDDDDEDDKENNLCKLIRFQIALTQIIDVKMVFHVL